MAEKLDIPAARVHWRAAHAVDQFAQPLEDFAPGGRVAVEVLCQATHASAVGVDHLWIERDRANCVCFDALLLQVDDLGLACRQRLPDLAEVGGAVLDRLDQPGQGLARLRDPALDRHRLALLLLLPDGDLVVVGPDQARHCLGREEPFCQADEHTPLQLRARDRHEDVARPRLASARAPDAGTPDDDHRAAAAAAAHEPGEQVFRPAPGDDRAGGALLGLILGRLPQLLRHDPQLRHVDHRALVGAVRARHASAAFRIAPHVDPIVEVAAGVDRIAQHPDPALAVAGERRSSPLASSRRRDAIGIEPLGDHLGRAAGDVLLVDPEHDRGLLRVQPAEAAVQLAARVELVDDLVAVGEPTRHAPAAHRALLAAPDLVREVLQEERAHRALQPDVELGDPALAERLDPDVREFQPLEDRRDVRLIAGDAVQRLCQYDVEGAGGRVREHRRHAGAPVAGAGDGDVGVDVRDVPAFPLRARGAAGDLVLGRGEGLLVGREASVDGAAGHESVLSWSKVPAASSPAIWRAIASTRAASAGVTKATPSRPRRRP